MDRLFAWFSRLSPRAALGDPSAPAFDEVDRYFLALRVGCAAAAGGWLWKLTAPGATIEAAVLVAAFIAYSLGLYLVAWRRPLARARAYLAALPADLAFLVLVCRWSAEPMSGVYLAFYLLVALHAFYFGARIGLAAAAGFAALYTTLHLSLAPGQRIAPEELAMRLLFAFFIAVSLGFVSRHLRIGRNRLAELNRQLHHRNRILEQTYRHLSLGRLAGGVAHTINNPAAVIVSMVDLLRRRAQRDGLPEIHLQRLATIAENAFRIARAVRSLVALAPQREGPASDLDLAQVAEGVVPLLETHAAEKRVRIERRLARGLRVHGQESSLRQVIVNLLCNALDAVGERGEVIVEVRRAREPHMVELRVCDNGHGIAPEHLDEIFSPFFTTKDGADGVGLGLSLSLAIVRRLGGTLAVESAPGKGAIFTVALPTDGHPAAPKEAIA